MNCGDWAEHRTALAEIYKGTFELIHWSSAPRAIPCAVSVRKGDEMG